MSIIINVQTYSSYLEALSHFVWLGEWIGSWEGIQIPFKQLKRPVLNRNRSQLWWKWTWFWKGFGDVCSIVQCLYTGPIFDSCGRWARWVIDGVGCFRGTRASKRQVWDERCRNHSRSRSEASERCPKMMQPPRSASICTLWWTNIAMENGHRNSGFSH